MAEPCKFKVGNILRCHCKETKWSSRYLNRDTVYEVINVEYDAINSPDKGWWVQIKPDPNDGYWYWADDFYHVSQTIEDKYNRIFQQVPVV
jgi:hypothetical protein